jgi:hypothetical protein
MHGMFFSNGFDAEIVDNKSEFDGSCVVEPKGRCDRRGSVPKFGQVRGKSVVGDSSCLFEPWHSFSYFHVYPPLGGCDGRQIVFGRKFGWDFVDVNFDIFIPRHGGAVIEVFDIKSSEAGIWG